MPTGAKQHDVGQVPLMPGDFETKYTALERAGRGSLGMGYENVNGQTVINSADPKLGAGAVGVRRGDLLLTIDGKDMRQLGQRGVWWHVIRPADAPIDIVVQSPGQPSRTVTTRMVLRHPKPSPPTGR